MKNGLQLSLDINDAPDTFSADERKLKQIIYNLLSNAVKFTPNGGQICVGARKVDRPVGSTNQLDDAGGSRASDNDTEKNKNSANKSLGCLEVSVSDTGIGIKPEDQVCIFKPFEQVRDSKGLNHQGTGLGLSLTKELVELHGGKIWVESECENKGCTFTFVIPI
jgi:signal transduction histidine kinase